MNTENAKTELSKPLPAPESQGQGGYDGHIAQRAYHPGDHGIYQKDQLIDGPIRFNEILETAGAAGRAVISPLLSQFQNENWRRTSSHSFYPRIIYCVLHPKIPPFSALQSD
jgi:hypothetical protein